MDEETTRGYEVVYREAIRALDLQRDAFDSLRARVGFLLSAATIATSFLGGLALRDRSDTGSWIAIFLFVAFGRSFSVCYECLTWQPSQNHAVGQIRCAPTRGTRSARALSSRRSEL